MRRTHLYELTNKIRLINETLREAGDIKWPEITTKRATNAKAQFESGKQLLRLSAEELLRQLYQQK
jgi:hypothetical protein